MKIIFKSILFAAIFLIIAACQKENLMEKEFASFLKDYESKVIPLSKESALADFDASISGKEEDYKKAADFRLELTKFYSDKEAFEKLKNFKKSGEIKEPLLKRQLDVIYNSYAANQLDEKLLEEIVNLSSKVENKFSTYRAEFNGKKYTDNEIDEILETSKNSTELEKAWKASKQIGAEVAPDIIKLVKLRNEAAIKLGYKNYHQMSLTLSEQNAEEIEKLFDELDSLTRNEFTQLKSRIDDYLSKKLNVPKDKLMPWHYQDKFFQQGPKIYDVDFDAYYKNKDIVEITRKYYDGLGLNIDDLIKNSDLYEKEGKYQHAYCTNIDRLADVRVVCNVKPNYRWMGTMMHEFGHAVYDKYLPEELPWSLRTPAHTFTTEAIAMLFGRMASSPQWIYDVIGISREEKEKIAAESFNALKLEQLTFSRWVQVMYRFEKSMYENPDQDLNALWWQLVEKYQMIKKPEGRDNPDWASKIHVALYPAYYHNYMLGELLASQLFHYINKDVLFNENVADASFNNSEDVGNYLMENYFKHGAKYPWNEMIEKATGEKLTAKYYADQFVK